MTHLAFRSRRPSLFIGSLGHLSLPLALLVLPAIPTGPIWAAEEADEPETLIVTTHRVPTTRDRSGSAVSVLGRETLSARQAIHGADVLQDVPGIAVSRLSGTGSQTQLRLRGAEANHVLVLIDGVKANDPAGSDEFDFSSLTAHDIERIEVVRGPQSALWGSEATAGVISITTRGADGPIASAFAEGGSRDTYYAGGRLGTGGDRGGVALNGSYYRTAGESAALVGTEADGSDNLTVGINADWQPGTSSRLAFGGRYTETDVEFDGLDFETGLPADADLASESELLLLRGEGGVALADDRWDHNLRLTYLESERRQLRDGEWESSTAADKLGAYYQSTLTFDVAEQRLILAADYERENFEQRGLVGFLDPNQDQRRDKIGWVGEYLVAPLTGLNLSGSLRYDDHGDFEDVTTGRVTASYLVSPWNARLRASYGSGQKVPTFVEQFGFFPDLFLGNPDLQPERSKGVDLGMSKTLADGAWRAELGYFDERLTSEIVTVFLPDSGLGTVENLEGKSRRRGAEVEIAGTLTERLSMSGSYTYTDSTQPDGQREVRRPRHMAAANLHLELPAWRAGINLNLSYTGAQTDQTFLPPTFAPETVKLDDYLLVNLAARLRVSAQLELYLRAENLLDEDYVNVVGYRTPGRSLHLGIRLARGR